MILMGIAAISPQTARALDGSVKFIGSVTGSTCSLDPANPTTLALPSVTMGTLTAAGKAYGMTPFSIKLVGCAATATLRYSTFFSSTQIDAAGNLLNTAAAPAATGVAVQLFSNSGSVAGTAMDLNQASGAQNAAWGGPVATGVELKYSAQYLASAATTPGAVEATVIYTVLYQ